MPIEAFIDDKRESNCHRQMKHWIGDKASDEGYSVEIEYETKKGFIDVFVQNETGKIAYECETLPKNNRLEDKLKRFGKYADEVIFVVPNNANLKKIDDNFSIIISPFKYDSIKKNIRHRDKVITVSVTEEEDIQIKKRASEEALSISAYCRNKVLKG